MPTGTKILIAVIVAIFGSVVIYYATVAPPTPGQQRPSDGTGAVPPGGNVAPAPARVTPVTPAPTPTPTPRASGTNAPTPPAADPAAGPQPSVSDPLNNTLRDPVRPVVNPTVPTQTGGKGDATPAGSPTVPQGSVPAASPTAPPTVSTPPAGGTPNPAAAPPSGPAPATPIKPTTPVTPPAGGPTPVAPPRGTGSPAGSPTTKGEHVVAGGETMSSIAEKHYGDRNKWQLIARANPLVDPANMKIGTKLTIPPASAPAGGGGGAPVTPPSNAPATAAGESVHTVGAGDTLISLSRRYYGKDGLWELIYDANRSVIGDDPAALKVGMSLRIPKKPS